MNQEMDWEEYEKILMLRPGFKEALEETRLEYEIARTKIKTRLQAGGKNRKLADIEQVYIRLIEQDPDKLIISGLL